METKKFSLGEFIVSEKFYFWFIAATMAAIPVGEFITELYNRPYVSQPYILAVSGCIGFVSVLLFFGKNAGSGKFELYPSDVFFILLVLFLTLTYIFAGGVGMIGDPVLFQEWMIHFLAYYSLMFAGTMLNDNKLRKAALYVFALVALFNGIVAFPQSFGLYITNCLDEPTGLHMKARMIYCFTQNCNSFAGLSVIFTAVSAGLFIFSESKRKKIIFFILYLLCFYCSIASTARIAWLGNIGVQCLYIISFTVMKIKKYNKEKLKNHFICWTLIIAVSAALLVYFALFTNVLQSGLQETLNDMSKDKGFEDFGSKRGYLWRFAIEAIPDNWLFGTGVSNFEVVFSSNPRYRQGDFFAFFAHNEYLHTIVTQGVFAGINYIAMLIYAAVTGVKTVIGTEDDEKRSITWILLGMFAGYAVQAFVNGSVINVAPYFWIVVGMTMPKCDQKPLRLKRRA